MTDSFDAVVIGSGYGGAIVGLRLAEAGYSVCILERGRRWDPKDYPRKVTDAWVWDQRNPRKHNGWFDLRLFKNMAVGQAAGVGGGSLVHINAVETPPADAFGGWPPEITLEELEPYYREVESKLRPNPIPEAQMPAKTRALRDAAEAAGLGEHFSRVNLAVRFDPGYDASLEPDAANSKKSLNESGVEQGTCVHLGNCFVGCEVRAKNTLDVNYIPLAEKHGAEVRALHLVRGVVPDGDGYRAHFERLDTGARGSVRGRLLIVAAGSLGSTELLLRARDEAKTLPNISGTLGTGWSHDAEFLTVGDMNGRSMQPTRGPTVTGGVRFFGDQRVDGEQVMIEDGGFPDVLRNYLQAAGGSSRSLRRRLAKMIDNDSLSALVEDRLPLLAQGRDTPDGVLKLKRRWWLFGPRDLRLEWSAGGSEAAVGAVIAAQSRLIEALDGTPFVPPTWTLAKGLITNHPLGGCPMGRTAADGVAGHDGEVFGHHNLFVIDSSLFPAPLGIFPTKTVAALAERAAELIVRAGR